MGVKVGLLPSSKYLIPGWVGTVPYHLPPFLLVVNRIAGGSVYPSNCLPSHYKVKLTRCSPLQFGVPCERSLSVGKLGGGGRNGESAGLKGKAKMVPFHPTIDCGIPESLQASP